MSRKEVYGMLLHDSDSLIKDYCLFKQMQNTKASTPINYTALESGYQKVKFDCSACGSVEVTVKSDNIYRRLYEFFPVKGLGYIIGLILATLFFGSVNLLLDC
ncbi:MAG: hypothetical protein HeimC2_08320 [Candidatus Heimdallarchaeota archaeon LC_2]|nr:MAG: hypothetical protein HeimC2_08320 [Candidatus Heimdallarchaeota archaeon LC_2]